MQIVMILLESALLYALRFISSPEGIALIDTWENELEARIASADEVPPTTPAAIRPKARNSAEGLVVE